MGTHYFWAINYGAPHLADCGEVAVGGETMTPEEKAEKWLKEHPGERESWAFFGTCWLGEARG